MESDLVLRLSDVYAHSSDSVESTEIVLVSLSKTGLVVDSICSSLLNRKSNVNEFLNNFKSIEDNVEKQKKKIKVGLNIKIKHD